MEAHELWAIYHQALRDNNQRLASEVLSKLHNYKSSPPRPSGGCAKCRKRFF